MKARLIKAKRMKELYDQIETNLDSYRFGDFEILKTDGTASIELDLDIHQGKLALMHCSTEDHREVENSILIFEALRELRPYLARDERLWTYLTHTELLNYSRQRWPIPLDDGKAVKHIQNHFFVGSARAVERDNAASRLWWMASLCSRVHGLAIDEALQCLLYQYDVRANIIERPTTSQSIHVFSAILKKLAESYSQDKSLFEREKFRGVMKNLNLRGGVKLLAALEPESIENVLEECIK